MTTIAILGATGHIAKGLISEIARQGRFGLILYSRRPKLVDNFLVDHSINRRNISVRPLQTFGATPCDVIINTIGAGDPKAVRDMGEGVIDLTAKYNTERVIQIVVATCQRLCELFFFKMQFVFLVCEDRANAHADAVHVLV